MNRVKFEDVVKRININVDRNNTERLYYVAGEHIESDEFMIHNKGLIIGSTIGYKFHYGFNPRHILFMSRNPHLRKASMVDFEGVCSDSTYVVETKDENVILQDYLLIEMQSDRFWKWMEEHKTGGVNYLINYRTLNQYEFDLPSLSEQKILAEKLWAAYRLKESYKRLLTATDEMVKSQFIEMFGDPIEHQENESLPTLKETVNVVSGYPFDSALFNVDNNGIPLIRIRDVVRGYSETYTTEPFDEQYIIRKGDLLIGMDGMFEISRWNSIDAALNQRVCTLRMKESENDVFIQYLVQPILKQIEKGTNATTVKHISTKQVLNIRVPDALKKQKELFASIAEQADKSKFELRKSIEAIDAVIKSLINN